MKITKQHAKIITEIDGVKSLKLIEEIGRICYNSHDKTTLNSYEPFVTSLIKRGHESVLEHISITVKFTTSIGIARELIRHRLCSFTEKSTRYVNEKEEIEFIEPIGISTEDYQEWEYCCKFIEASYMQMKGVPQLKREVLMLSTATNIVVTTNLREWRHILKLRTSKAAHPLMRALMTPLLNELQVAIPIVFDDIKAYTEEV